MTYNSSKTGAQVDGAVDDVQAAKAASATDTTAGRLLKVGDFGWGATNYRADVADLNATTFNGVHSYTSTSLNSPADVILNAFGPYIHISRFSGEAWQIAADARSGNMLYRSVGALATTPWRELFHTGNLLGTVSQSGGVPTGAVIESGSSLPAGQPEVIMRRWTRFADGTQIVYLMFYTNLNDGTFQTTTPIGFINNPSFPIMREASATLGGGQVVDIVTGLTTGGRTLTESRCSIRNNPNPVSVTWKSIGDGTGGNPNLTDDRRMFLTVTVTGRWF